MKKKVHTLLRRILKIPYGCASPKWLLYFLFPIKNYLLKQTHIRYDFEKDEYHIEGVVINARLLMWLKNKEGFNTIENLIGDHHGR